MGLMQQVCNTYQSLEKTYVGKYSVDLKEPLAPISHQVVKADIEVTLDECGNFLSATAVNKADTITIIPVTRKSPCRTGDSEDAHPLSDQLQYVSPIYTNKHDAYKDGLRKWVNSSYSHPKIKAILNYIEKGSIIADLYQAGLIKYDKAGNISNKKDFVRWRVESSQSDVPSECWKDQSLFQAFIEYYKSELSCPDEIEYCMITGNKDILCDNNPKNIAGIHGNAKLISFKDPSKLGYQGRFIGPQQALSVGYEASQMAHNTLHWLIANQGVICGNGRIFLCWNPQGIKLPKPTNPILRQTEDDIYQLSDYQKALRDTLQGIKQKMTLDAKAIIASFDAATTGRLALTYYSELQASDFLDRLSSWDNTCCWWYYHSKIIAPTIVQIVQCAFGNPVKDGQKYELRVDDRLMRQQTQTLLTCRVDKKPIPLDIERALLRKASNLQLYTEEMPYFREKVLSTACAVVRKYHYDRNKEEWSMALEPKKKDISYQYGRMLAVLEKIEKDTYKRDDEKKRETNAIRMQAIFAKRPQYASRMIWEKVKNAYYPQLKPAQRTFYDKLLGEIVEQISLFTETEQKRSLADTYLLGYYLQQNALYQSKKTDNKQEEEA